ncbi:MAG: hypothetical protein GEV10_28965 [Streptosporangiales bacterium]|nr:hypothetical protein [Streptosporangiales bacterium]
MKRRVSMFGAMAAVVVLVAACGSSGGTGGSGDDAGKLTITSPKDGASVQQPFTLKFDAGDIGATDTGKDHVHIFIDGKETDYTVVTKSSFVIKGVSKGEHTINVTKQHADHSPAGDKAEIEVNVTDGGAPSSSTGDGGTDYGY